MKKRPTQKEVAQQAGVSQAVVSQVLNGRSGGIRLHPQTRARVLETMKQMGYVPNMAAQSLAGGRNHILGVFTYEPVFPTDTRDFFYPFLEGIEDAAAALEYDLLLHTRPAAKGSERQVYRDNRSRLTLADGTLLLGELRDEQRRGDVARLLGEGHHMVFVGRRELPGHTLVWAGADYASATAQATRTLLGLGHRRLLYLGGTRQRESAEDREAGYWRGLGTDAPGRTLRLNPQDITAPLVQSICAEGLTGLLIENDDLALRWLEVSDRLGLCAPQDYSFVVLGDPVTQTRQPLPRPWTSFRLPRREMGQQAVRLLDEQLRGLEPQSLLMPCTWELGDSIGPAPVS
ncbi:LacI family DNA-binding transcriptional regulator [Deinococcus ruber]|uniref:LacI family DNA-binding transcriptional regulator n=1 Tax=Deinococcus ruber TaxID=1848197 RepID=UPI001E4E7F57|nr:LacI family DNA-binding transcriptional regulator [Deinococcus ruber]